MGGTTRKLAFEAEENRLAWAAYKEVCRQEGEDCLERLDCGAATYELPGLAEVKGGRREGLSLVLFDWKGKGDGKVEAREVLEYIFSRPEKYRRFIEETVGRRPTELTDGLSVTESDDQLAERARRLISLIKEEVARTPHHGTSDAGRIQDALVVASAYPKTTFLIVDDDLIKRLRNLHLLRFERDLRSGGGIGLKESIFGHRGRPAGEVLAEGGTSLLAEPDEQLHVIAGLWETAGIPGSFVLLYDGGADVAQFVLKGAEVCYKSATERANEPLAGRKLTPRQYQALHLENLAKRQRGWQNEGEAVRLLDLAAQLEPLRGDPLFLQAGILLDHDDRKDRFFRPLFRDSALEAAERLVNRGLTADPRNPLGWYTRARVEERKGASRPLVNAANEALKLSQSGSDLHKGALYLRAIGYENLGEYDKALQDLAGLEKRPGDWTSYDLYIDRFRIWVESKIF